MLECEESAKHEKTGNKFPSHFCCGMQYHIKYFKAFRGSNLVILYVCVSFCNFATFLFFRTDGLTLELEIARQVLYHLTESPASNKII